MARSPANFLRTLARAIDHLFITIGLIYYDWTQRKFPWPLTGGPVFPVPRGPPGISPDRAAGHRILWVNHRATIIWHTERIPDEYRLTPPRPDPERIDLSALKTVAEQVWAGGGSLDIEMLEGGGEHLDFNVRRCRYAEFYKELGEPELGFLLVCSADFDTAEGFGPDVKLTRTQTIMQGASHCDFRYGRVKEP